MAYLIITANGTEIDRRELKSAVTIGRASECTICVRDIMMSRSHCRIEQQGDAWILTDLQSRNGTCLGHERVERHLLREGDSLRMGRTFVTFHAGKFEPGPKLSDQPARVRPSDPNESFAGTVVGFELLEPGQAEYDEQMPIPQPRPLEPAGYECDDVYDMLHGMASSAWDSIHETEAPPMRKQKVATQATVETKPIRRKSRVSFALQAHERAELIAPQPTGVITRAADRWRALTSPERRAVAVMLSVSVTLIAIAGFLAVESRTPQITQASAITMKATPVLARAVAQPPQQPSEPELASDSPDDSGQFCPDVTEGECNIDAVDSTSGDLASDSAGDDDTEVELNVR